jgi:hypothetical protein
LPEPPVPPLPVEPPVPVVPPLPVVLWHAGTAAAHVKNASQAIGKQDRNAFARAAWFEQCIAATVAGQFALHCIAAAWTSLPASGVQARPLSQLISHRATSLPLPLLLPPQPCIEPAMKASDAPIPTNNVISFVDIARNLLGGG